MSNILFALADGYEDAEFRYPHDTLREAGHDITIVGLEAGATVRGKQGEDSAVVDATARDVDAGDFDAMVIPGGRSPAALRDDVDLVALTRSMVDQRKPVAAICHGPQLLAAADVLRHKALTSHPAVREAVEAAGGGWVDLQVCVSDNLITSRAPDDLPAFAATLLDRIAACAS